MLKFITQKKEQHNVTNTLTAQINKHLKIKIVTFQQQPSYVSYYQQGSLKCFFSPYSPFVARDWHMWGPMSGALSFFFFPSPKKYFLQCLRLTLFRAITVALPPPLSLFNLFLLVYPMLCAFFFPLYPYTPVPFLGSLDKHGLKRRVAAPG